MSKQIYSLMSLPVQKIFYRFILQFLQLFIDYSNPFKMLITRPRLVLFCSVQNLLRINKHICNNISCFFVVIAKVPFILIQSVYIKVIQV